MNILPFRSIPFLEENVPRKGNQLPKPLFNDSPKETQRVGAGPETQGRRKSKLLWKESGATNHLGTQRNQPSSLKINPPNLSRKNLALSGNLPCKTEPILTSLNRNRYRRFWNIFFLLDIHNILLLLFLNFDYYLQNRSNSRIIEHEFYYFEKIYKYNKICVK